MKPPPQRKSPVKSVKLSRRPSPSKPVSKKFYHVKKADFSRYPHPGCVDKMLINPQHSENISYFGLAADYRSHWTFHDMNMDVMLFKKVMECS
jgi:hypothetical protein